VRDGPQKLEKAQDLSQTSRPGAGGARTCSLVALQPPIGAWRLPAMQAPTPVSRFSARCAARRGCLPYRAGRR
jgi:hypothetical protein